jgi:hypothetical protein
LPCDSQGDGYSLGGKPAGKLGSLSQILSHKAPLSKIQQMAGIFLGYVHGIALYCTEIPSAACHAQSDNSKSRIGITRGRREDFFTWNFSLRIRS